MPDHYTMRSIRGAFFTVVAVIATLLGGCMIGNSSSNDCTSTGSASDPGCLCSGIGNCTYDCPAGGCDLQCRNTGNCIMNCAGCGCTLHCNNTGTCVQMGCTDAGSGGG